MIQLPRYITFTGVDSYTNIGEMTQLSRSYPVEWGVLMSPSRSGDDKHPRYPSWEVISRIVRIANKASLAAHICGGYVTELLDTGSIRGVDAVLGRYFGRVQVNVPESLRGDLVTTSNLVAWSKRVGVRLILQSSNEKQFPASVNKDVQWLFDPSGGRGIRAARYPVAERGRDPVGFAGGLQASNVREKVAVFGRHADLYWIDMETGVRDAQDRFDLAACRAVCEEVYGKSLFEVARAPDLGEQQSMMGMNAAVTTR